MTIENHVTNLELSKRLRELGVTQKSLFYWFECPYKKIWVVGNPNKDWEHYSAFLESEIVNMLPNMSYAFRVFENNWISQSKFCEQNFRGINGIEANTKMLIHLIETGIVKVEDLK